MKLELCQELGMEAREMFESEMKKLCINPFILSCSIYYENSPVFYWAWAASVVGPVVYVLAVVHAVLWKLPSAVVGSLVSIQDFSCHIHIS